MSRIILDRILQTGSIQQYLTFEIAQFNIPASSTITRSVTLNRSDYQYGILVFDDDFGEQLGGFIQFTTDINDASSKSEIKEEVLPVGFGLLCSYTATDWRTKSYFYANDSFLTEYGNPRSDLRIQSVRINGSNVDIVFQSEAPNTRLCRLRGSIRVWV